MAKILNFPTPKYARLPIPAKFGSYADYNYALPPSFIKKVEEEKALRELEAIRSDSLAYARRVFNEILNAGTSQVEKLGIPLPGRPLTPQG